MIPEYVKLRIVAVIRIVIRGSVAPIEARSLKTVLKSVRHFLERILILRLITISLGFTEPILNPVSHQWPPPVHASR